MPHHILHKDCGVPPTSTNFVMGGEKSGWGVGVGMSMINNRMALNSSIAADSLIKIKTAVPHTLKLKSAKLCTSSKVHLLI